MAAMPAGASCAEKKDALPIQQQTEQKQIIRCQVLLRHHLAGASLANVRYGQVPPLKPHACRPFD